MVSTIERIRELCGGCGAEGEVTELELGNGLTVVVCTDCEGLPREWVTGEWTVQCMVCGRFSSRDSADRGWPWQLDSPEVVCDHCLAAESPDDGR